MIKQIGKGIQARARDPSSSHIYNQYASRISHTSLMQESSNKEMRSRTRVERSDIVQGAKWVPPCACTHSRSLVDRDTLDVEDQVRVGGDVRGSTLLAVSHRGGDGEATLATSGHASDTDVPALDDLADAELESERLALLVGFATSVFVRKLPNFQDLQSKTLPFFSFPM